MKKIISIILVLTIIVSIFFTIPVNAAETEYIDIFIPCNILPIHEKGECKPYVPADITEDEFLNILFCGAEETVYNNDGTVFCDPKNDPEYDVYKFLQDFRKGKWHLLGDIQHEVNSDYPDERNYWKCSVCDKEYDTYEEAFKNDACCRYTVTKDAYNIIINVMNNLKNNEHKSTIDHTTYARYFMTACPRRTYARDDYFLFKEENDYIEEDPNFYHGVHTFLSIFDFNYTCWKAYCQDKIKEKEIFDKCEFDTIPNGWSEASPIYTNINYTGKPFYGLQVQPINTFNDGIPECQDANYEEYYYSEKISDFYTGTPNYNTNIPGLVNPDFDGKDWAHYFIDFYGYNNIVSPQINNTEEPTTTPTLTPTVIPTTTPTPTVIPTTVPTTKPSTTKPNKSTKPTVSPVVKPTINIKKGVIYTKNSNVYKVTKVTIKNNKVVGGNVTYVTNNNNSVKSVSIPSSIKIKGINFKVTSISSNAFKSCKKLKSVKIGKNVTKIGTKTFSNCKKLKTVTIKSNKIKNVNKKSFNTSTKIKVPKKYYSSYVKLFKKVNISKSRIVKY